MAGAATEERTARQSWGLQAALVTAEPVSVRERPAERDFSLVSILQRTSSEGCFTRKPFPGSLRWVWLPESQSAVL